MGVIPLLTTIHGHAYLPSATDLIVTEERRFLQALGERLRTMRRQRGMPRRVLSDQSGVSERYIAQMEAGSGNVSILLLRALAGALGVGITDLLAEAPTPAGELLRDLTPDQIAEARQLLLRHFGAKDVPDRSSRIALIGLRGAGKSALGGLLAKQRGVAGCRSSNSIGKSNVMRAWRCGKSSSCTDSQAFDAPNAPCSNACSPPRNPASSPPAAASSPNPQPSRCCSKTA
jgi:transcriptional regulator with XRE-family HTH domain